MKRGTRTGLTGLQNPGLELEMTGSTNMIQWSACSQESRCPQRSRSSVLAVVKAATQWASYSGGRWKQKRRTADVHLKYSGLCEEDKQDEEHRDEPDTPNEQHLNQKLLNHFRQLAATNQDTDQVDLQFLDQVISHGADPNSSDRYGQTILHEISRAWSVDVMRFFLDRGSDLNQPDQFGVTALHVASALDYQDMVQFLLNRKADPEARTLLDQQTPLHYAAKNDAVGSIRLLLKAGASISSKDYKHRTPLQLAANLERSEAAQLLLELGAKAGIKDSDGQLCMTALIGQMSPVARLALGQFHVTDKVTRQQYYYLNLLEPELCLPKTPLQEAVVNEPTSPAPRFLSGPAPVVAPPTALRTSASTGPALMPLIRQIQTVLPNGTPHPAALMPGAGPESGLIYAAPYDYPYTLAPASILEYPLDSGAVLGKPAPPCSCDCSPTPHHHPHGQWSPAPTLLLRHTS
ncbi:Protein quaking-A [Larimichthys crocea]|uniref:Protein quaking-A n=1 Tax=Larimichthys crocea TaxID=215358 RepID=A0A6G0HPA2_LARCR|nr:Protein quaking-A [Larimichthys crocea]